MKIAKFLPVVLASFAFAHGASAAVIDNSTITILPGSSASFPTYESSFALDSGANRYSSDFAGQGTGVGTHLDFAFSAPTSFGKIVYTDRTSSGGANNSNQFGVSDYVEQYQYIFANDTGFNDIVGTYTSISMGAPSTHDSYFDFQHTDMIAGFTAQYVRFQVLETNGLNPGAADFEFSTAAAAVPEPGSIALLGLGLLGFAASRRKAARK